MSERDLDEEARRYQWYAGYDRSTEYEKHPEWATEVSASVVDEAESAAERDTVRFESDDGWLESDRAYNLVQMI